MKVPPLAIFLLASALLPSTMLADLPKPQPIPPGKVACVGDSITEGSGTTGGMSYPRQLQDLFGSGWTVGNFGVGGRTLLRKGDFPYWKEKALLDAQAFAPNAVVIMLGTNDTKPQNWVHRSEFLSDYRDLVKIFQGLPSKPQVYICRPCPVRGPGNYGINESALRLEIPIVDQVARELHVNEIDLYAALKPVPQYFPDNVHPNNDGAGVMAHTVYEALTGRPAPAPTK